MLLIKPRLHCRPDQPNLRAAWAAQVRCKKFKVTPVTRFMGGTKVQEQTSKGPAKGQTGARVDITQERGLGEIYQVARSGWIYGQQT